MCGGIRSYIIHLFYVFRNSITHGEKYKKKLDGVIARVNNCWYKILVNPFSRSIANRYFPKTALLAGTV